MASKYSNIWVLFIIAVLLSSCGGGAEQTTAPASPTTALATIKIEVTSSTWRDAEPYDIYGAVGQRLRAAGFEIASEGEAVYDAKLSVVYREERGDKYSRGTGTDIKCSLRLLDSQDDLLLEEEIRASTSLVVFSGGLYGSAVDNFEEQVYFQYLGEIIATRFGVGDEISVLISALDDMAQGTRYSAVVALGEAEDTRAVEPLMVLLSRDSAPGVRGGAATALGRIKDARAVEALTVALQDELMHVRGEAAWALGEIGDSRAIVPLTGALDDENPYVQAVAQEALDKIEAGGR